MPLLDQFGDPVKPDQLKRQDAAGPTMVGWRPAVVSTPVIDLDPRMLAGLLLAADNGDSLSWQILAAEIERRDLHYLGVLNTRKRTVSQVPITVEPAGEDAEQKKHADFVQEWLDTGVLQLALYDMLDAIGKGWSVHEIEWNCEPGSYTPRCFKFRPQRWFEISYEDGETINIRGEAEPGAPPDAPDAPPLAGQVAMDPNMFLVHRHPSWSGLTIGSGLTRLAAWAFMFKTFTQRDWAVFCQNYGAPVRVGRYGPEASGDDRNVLWRAVSSIAGDCAAIIPRGMEIEFIETKNTGASSDMHKARCDWLDAQMSKAVLGQTGTTDANPGSHAAGRTHRLVQEDIERADCMLLAATINRHLISRMVAFSFGQQKAYPRISIGRPDEAPNSELITLIQWAGPQGLTIRAQEIRDRFNLTEPEDGDEVIGGRAPTPPVQPAEDLPGETLPPEDRPGSAPPPTGQQPEQKPPQPPEPVALHSQLVKLLEARSDGTQLITLMTQKLADRAGAGLASMVDQARQVVERAGSLEEMMHGLDALQLDNDQFAAAMVDGIAIAELAGQAAFLDSVATRTPT